MRPILLLSALGLCLVACESAPPRVLSSRDILSELSAGMVLENHVDAGAPDAANRRVKGWRAPERGNAGNRQVWTGSVEAVLSLPWTGRDGAVAQLLLRIYCNRDGGPARELRLTLNGTAIHRGPTPDAYQTLAIELPPDILWRGENELVLGVDRVVERDGRRYGMLVDFVGLRPPSDEPAPQSDPTEDLGDRVILAEGRSILCRLPDLSEQQVTLRTFSEHLPATARIHARLPEAGDAWAEFEGAVIDRKAEFFMRFPAGLPPGTPLELRMSGADDARLRITAAELVSTLDARNVVLLVVDTLRADYLGCYGHPSAQTPNIDALVADGVLFENAFAPIPITGPSHASLLQSRTPSELGVLNNLRFAIPQAVPTLPELLRGHGYRATAIVSIDPLRRGLGFERGFDAYDDRMGSNWIVPGEIIKQRAVEQVAGLGTPFFFWSHFSDPHEPYDAHGLVKRHARVLLDGEVIANVETTKYSSTEIKLNLPSRASILRFESDDAFLVRRAGFLGPISGRPKLSPPIVSYAPAHHFETEIGASGDRKVTLAVGLHDRMDDGTLLERYKREVEFTDRQVGAILDSLKAAGFYEESWIVFTSDHGEGLGCHDHIGHVQNLYDCLTHVPLIIKPPASSPIRGGKRRKDVCSLIDVAPTILQNLGTPHASSMRGENLFARNKAARREAAVFLETHTPEAKRTKFALRTNDQKIIWTPETDRWELYDLDSDPDEKNDLCHGDPPTDAAIYVRFRETLAAIHSSATEHADERPLDEDTAEALRSLGYVE